MTIKTVEDIYENAEYYMYIGKDFKGKPLKPRRVRLLGIVQEFNKSEFYVCNLARSGKQAYWTTNIFGINESGLGKSEEEAINNYARITDIKLERAYGSQESIQADLKKVEYAPKKYTYYNYRNVKSENVEYDT